MPKRTSNLKLSANVRNTVLNLSALNEKGEIQHPQSDEKIQKLNGDDETYSPKPHDESAETKSRNKSRNYKNYYRPTTHGEIERNFINNGLAVVRSTNHHLLPAFNVGSISHDINELLAQYPKYAFINPQPIYVSATRCRNVDLCHKRPMAWEHYRHRLLSARTAYHRAMKSKKHVRAVEKHRIYHTSVFDLAERIYQQPDPYFYGSYDHYYTGGNLCYLPATQNLLHCTGENLQTLEIAKLTKPFVVGENNFFKNLPINLTLDDGEIFEVISLKNMMDMSNGEYLLARQRNVINLLQLKNDTKMKIISQFRTKSTPFISMTQSLNNPSTVLITSMKQHIRSYDISRDSAKLAKLYEISSKSNDPMWNTIKTWQENCFLYANQYQLHIVDIRTTPNEWLKYAISDNCENEFCDHISALGVSSFKNLFYIATHHKLHCLDVRNLNDCKFLNSNATVCRWTHQCEYAPLLLDTCRLDKNEYIALSSALADDINICELSRQTSLKSVELDISQKNSKYIYKSDCLAYQPLTLMETLNGARLAGKCLLPESNVQARIKSCTTGMSFCELTDDSSTTHNYLTFSNSIGDIYAYTIRKRLDLQHEDRRHADGEQVMDRYSAETCRFQQNILNYTNVTDLKFLRNVLTCEKFNYPPDYNSDGSSDFYEEFAEDENEVGKFKITRRMKRLGRWQKSLKALHSCKDVLADKLLSVWNIEEEVYDADDTEKLNMDNVINERTPFVTKVSNWLNEYSNFKPAIKNTNEMETTCTNELQTSPQILQKTFDTNSVQQATSSFKKKIKKKHIKGF